MARDIVDVIVGRNVKELRNHFAITQMTLAAHIGVSFQQVQKYEKGTNRISASTLYHICLLLNCTPNYLFRGLTFV